MSANIKMTAVSLCAALAVAFVSGALVTAKFAHVPEVVAAGDRSFELMVYHTQPGKVPDLESIFKDVSLLQAKHGLTTIAYWVPTSDVPAWKDTFVYLVAHKSEDDAKKNWDALHADPDFLPYRKAAVPLIRQVDGRFQVDEIFMRPTAFSTLR